ncbi:MAG: PGF-CTERM sorting domain-containing protein, partial [Halobacteriota archaeon]|nr:PGF-CTERM sorting domain-containing protein [Halobacteriota archaeon]
SMLKDGDTEGINAFHIGHVETLSMSCIQCHKVDEELPTLKRLVSEDTCVPCHKEGSMGREIFTSADDMQTTTDDKETTMPETATDEEAMGEDEETPGFEAILAVTGLLAVAYLVLRRNR